MSPQSSRSQSPDIKVQTVQVDTNPDDMRDGGHDASGCALSERARVEGCTAYVMDFSSDKHTTLRRILRGPRDLEWKLSHRAFRVCPEPVELPEEVRAKHIIVVHGLPMEYIELLRDSSLVDAHVVDSISRRRPARHIKKAWSQYLSYEYPEQLMRSENDASRSSCNLNLAEVSSSPDLLDDPPRFWVPDANREVAICRATLRLGTKVNEKSHVLFLDRCLWRNSPRYSKPLEGNFVSKPCACDGKTKHSWDLDKTTHYEEEDSLEHRIWEYLKNDDTAEEFLWSENYLPLQKCFAHCVYASWAEFLDNLTLEGDRQKYVSLLQQLQRSLERNLDAEISLEGVHFTGSGWQGLLERVERKVRMATQLSPATAIQMPAAPEPVILQQVSAEEGISSQQNVTAPDNESKENQRSLDRVAYLGGLLLPMTIVSGILAMGDTFGPTGNMFYVFWATAVPLTLLTLAIIYADSIRRVEIWIEAQSTFESPAGASGRLMGKKKPLRHQGTAVPDLEQAAPYSETIPVDYGTTEAFMRAGEPVTYVAEEPAIIAEPGEPRVWKKEELGWLGACKSMLGIYKLDELRKRPRAFPTKMETVE